MPDKHAPPPNYSCIETAAWRKARKMAQEEAAAKSARLIKAAQAFSWRTGYPVPEILAQIQADEMIAATFASSPMRTDLHRREAARWLQSLPWVEDFEKLPARGAKALRISAAGAIESSSISKNLPGHALNFKWRCGGRTFYAMHKHIKNDGGHRSSRHHEMIDLLARFAKSRPADAVLLVIADGDYYQQNDRAKLKELREHARAMPPRSHALSIDEVPALLEKYAGGETLSD